MMMRFFTLGFMELRVKYMAVTLSYLLLVNVLDLIPLKAHGHHHLFHLGVHVFTGKLTIRSKSQVANTRPVVQIWPSILFLPGGSAELLVPN